MCAKISLRDISILNERHGLIVLLCACGLTYATLNCMMCPLMKQRPYRLLRLIAVDLLHLQALACSLLASCFLLQDWASSVLVEAAHHPSQTTES